VGWALVLSSSGGWLCSQQAQVVWLDKPGCPPDGWRGTCKVET
jgi:hypothetical protein